MSFPRVAGTVLAIGMAFGCSAAHAQLSATDSGYGANTVIQDAWTGMDWLRLDLSQGMSQEQVIAQTGVGGTFEGYRLATGAEIDNLLTRYVAGPYGSSAGASAWWSNGSTTDLTIVQNSFNFLSLFGWTTSAQQGPFNFGMTAFFYGECTWPIGEHCGGTWVDGVGWGVAGGLAWAGHPDYAMASNVADPRASAMLVAQPIPEPETYALMAMGLLAVGVQARRRKTQGAAK